ncbi:ABC-type multidrug transport system fused ATPase/permease subunit [Streptomyces sp. TE33382]
MPVHGRPGAGGGEAFLERDVLVRPDHAQPGQLFDPSRVQASGFVGFALVGEPCPEREDPAFQDRLRMARGAAGQSVGRLIDNGLRIASGTLTTVGFLTALYALDATMTVLVAASAIPALVAELKLSHRRARTEWHVSAAQRREFFFQMLLSGLDAAKEIRLFGAGGFLKERMLAERRTANTEIHRTDRRELLTQGLNALLSAVVAGVGLIWAALAARHGQLTVGEVSMFVAAIVGVHGALSGLIRSLADGHQQLLMSLTFNVSG